MTSSLYDFTQALDDGLALTARAEWARRGGRIRSWTANAALDNGGDLAAAASEALARYWAVLDLGSTATARSAAAGVEVRLPLGPGADLVARILSEHPLPGSARLPVDVWVDGVGDLCLLVREEGDVVAAQVFLAGLRGAVGGHLSLLASELMSGTAAVA